MVLEDYRQDCMVCSRCSYCKFIPFDQVKSAKYARACPSIEYAGFQAYSLGGRLSVGLSLMENRIEYNEALKDIVWKCNMDGACNVSDKVCRYNIEGLDVMHAMRVDQIDHGQTLEAHQPYIESIHKEHNMMLKPKAERADWAKGLKVKDLTQEKADVLFFAGCRFSYDPDLQKVARSAVTILQNAGVDLGIMGIKEACCGGRAYAWGYEPELEGMAKKNIKKWTDAGIKMIVTPCAECYHSFKRLYPQFGSTFKFLHVVEYLDMLIKEGKLRLTKVVPLTVTYHDPCHLGRLGEEYVPWKGERRKIYGQIPVWEPPRPRYTGAFGVYDAPRNVLKAIPGLKLVEMERIKEYAWCCGASGGVMEAYPDFAATTANTRIDEAKSTGAEAIVSACGWCERSFIDSVAKDGNSLKVMDIIELVEKAI